MGKISKNVNYAERYSVILVRSGILLFMASLINGFLIHSMNLQRLSLSAHLLGIMGATLLIGLGAFWSRLTLSQKASRLGAIFAIYGFWVGWVLYFVSAATGSGRMFPILSNNTVGKMLIENLISFGMMTLAISLFSLCFIVLKGLRR